MMDPEWMNWIAGIWPEISFERATLGVLGLAGLIATADFVGLLPPKIAAWLARNRLESILKSLTQLGVRVCWDDNNTSAGLLKLSTLTAYLKEPAYKVQLRVLLAEETYEGNMNVGSSRVFATSSFIDVMGGTTSIARAVEYAKILNTHAHIESIESYDLIAAPKSGSPILGYEFSRLVKKPLILGASVKVADTENKMGLHAVLDFPKNMDLTGRKILIVDDSTTGGRKFLELANYVRQAGGIVSDALVLFEPEGKGARDLLKKNGINLHSVIDGPKGVF